MEQEQEQDLKKELELLRKELNDKIKEIEDYQSEQERKTIENLTKWLND